MYKFLIRSILFLFNPEWVHHFTMHSLKILFRIPFISKLVRRQCHIQDDRLRRKVWGLDFTNPVGLAAGFDKNALCYNELSSFGFSFIEVGTVTPRGQAGNPKPRLFRLKRDRGLINRMGFNNMGAEKVAANLQRRTGNLIVGGNIGKNTATPNQLAVNDYIITFNEIYDFVDYLVINVSCPNVADLHELQDSDSLAAIVNALEAERKKRNLRKPMLLKVSPDLNFTQIDELIETVKNSGIDGFVATNTSTGREKLSLSPDQIRKIGNGGLSGAPLRDRSTELIRYIFQKTNGNLPIIGTGGIMSPQDALDKLNAGASLIQLYTGFIYEGPLLIRKINKKLISVLS